MSYLTNVTGPVSLVLDLHIDHDRFGSSSEPSLNDHLHYLNDVDKSLNEVVTDKIRKHRVVYTNNPPDEVSFMSVITSSSGRLQSEFIRLLFLQDHRETDRFFAPSGVHLVLSTSGLFHFRHTVSGVFPVKVFYTKCTEEEFVIGQVLRYSGIQLLYLYFF